MCVISACTTNIVSETSSAIYLQWKRLKLSVFRVERGSLPSSFPKTFGHNVKLSKKMTATERLETMDAKSSCASFLDVAMTPAADVITPFFYSGARFRSR